MKRTKQKNRRIVIYAGDDPLNICNELAMMVRNFLMILDPAIVPKEIAIKTEFDEVSTCEYCGAPWESNLDVYNFGCCDQDYRNGTPYRPMGPK
jgi:protein-arginine kinase activator protein McsA